MGLRSYRRKIAQANARNDSAVWYPREVDWETVGPQAGAGITDPEGPASEGEASTIYGLVSGALPVGTEGPSITK